MPKSKKPFGYVWRSDDTFFLRQLSILMGDQFSFFTWYNL